jgi:putative nucleotidyltransferase with HDIG domain
MLTLLSPGRVILFEMLLLTDRPDGSVRLWQDLCLVRPCQVVPLEAALPDSGPFDVTICDVAFNKAASVTRLREALSRLHAPGTPLLCLIHEKNHHLTMQAQAVGATEILQIDGSHDALCTRLVELFGLAEDEGRLDEQRRHLARVGIVKAGLAFSGLFDAAATGEPLRPELLEQGSDAVLGSVRQADIRTWLDVVWNHDDITYQHCLLVAGLAAAFAQKLGFRQQDQRLLSQAALLHDIGKAQVPLDILNKPDRLTPEEMAVMRTHPVAGHELLLRQPGFDPRLLDVVRHHHEYLDGSGYPDRLRGAQISDLNRLTTICDIYAALIERRAYKPPLSPDRALSIMVEMGDKLDRALLHAFRDVVAAIGPEPAFAEER